MPRTKKQIYKPKPLKDWKFVNCTGAKATDKLILMSETGNTGDCMFHAFIQVKDKTSKEIKEEAKAIYESLLNDIAMYPHHYEM